MYPGILPPLKWSTEYSAALITRTLAKQWEYPHRLKTLALDDISVVYNNSDKYPRLIIYHLLNSFVSGPDR